MLGIFVADVFCRLLIFFKVNYFSNSFENATRVSISLDPDQARQFVGPDLDPNCLQSLPADYTRSQTDNDAQI